MLSLRAHQRVIQRPPRRLKTLLRRLLPRPRPLLLQPPPKPLPARIRPLMTRKPPLMHKPPLTLLLLLMQLPLPRPKLKLPPRPMPLLLPTPLLRQLRAAPPPSPLIMACKKRQNRSVTRLRPMLRESMRKKSHIRKLRPPKSRLKRSRLRAKRRPELQRRSLSSSMPRIRRCRPPRKSLRDRSKTPRELLVIPSRKRPERRSFA